MNCIRPDHSENPRSRKFSWKLNGIKNSRITFTKGSKNTLFFHWCWGFISLPSWVRKSANLISEEVVSNRCKSKMLARRVGGRRGRPVKCYRASPMTPLTPPTHAGIANLISNLHIRALHVKLGVGHVFQIAAGVQSESHDDFFWKLWENSKKWFLSYAKLRWS